MDTRLTKFKGVLAILLAVALIAAEPIETKAAMAVGDFDLIMTNAGEDSSKEMNFAWHSKYPSCDLEYTFASDPGFENKNTITVNGELSTVEKYYDIDKDDALYVYEVTLENLEPGTEYIYRLTNEGIYSEEYFFKTADEDGNVTFGWIGDVHSDPTESYKIKNSDAIFRKIEEQNNEKPLDFIIFSGDIVRYGNHYAAWKQWDNSDLFRHHLMATTTGNKEYYRLLDFNSDTKIKYYSGEWYNEITNNPANGPEELDESNYWFIYDGVLVMNINSCQEADYNNKVLNDPKAILASQREWFEKVVNEQKGKYRYIVVVEHYAYWILEDGGIPCDWGGYENWKDLFDKYGVDYALSGDYHEYARTNEIANDALSDSGTVYITFSEITDSVGKIGVMDAKNELVAKISSNGSEPCGGLFEADKDQLTFKLMAYDGSVVDSVSVKAKRQIIKPDPEKLANARYFLGKLTYEIREDIKRVCVESISALTSAILGCFK